MAKLQPIYNNLQLLRAVNPLLERELESKEVKMIFVTYTDYLVCPAGGLIKSSQRDMIF